MLLNNLNLKYLAVFLFSLVFIQSNSAQKNEIKVYEDFDSFEQDWLKWDSDTTLVLNFWATWCKPCVQELPYFEALNHSKSDTPIKVILVSIDKKSDIDSRLKPFLSKREMTTKVLLLAAGGAHIWIDKVDPSWSGAIPATVLLKKGKKEFYEKEFESMEELLTAVTNFSH